MNGEKVIYRPFPELLHARFLKRINRFLVECELSGRRIRAFLPNPGRLQELLLPDAPLYIIKESETEGRATSYTAVAVIRDGQPIMLHTHKTNLVVSKLLEEGCIPGFEETRIVKQEVGVGRSRFDFLLKDGKGDMFLEVKSCTLVGKDVAMFPDAVTARGSRHLEELSDLSRGGIRSAVIFAVHWPHASVFMPDYHTDLNFARNLLAVRESVRVVPLSIRWLPDLSLSSQVRILDIPWSYIEREAQDRGSYLLILELPEDVRVDVGKLGSLSLRRGFYIYVGSAMGNLCKRIERHRRLRKNVHWHIDYLRPYGKTCTALAVRSSERLECAMARAIEEISDWSVRGFGCSDCDCQSHLFAMHWNPLLNPSFHAMLQHFRMDRYQSIASS